MQRRSLNDKQIAEAKRMLGDGAPINKIAEHFGCHAQTIRRAVDARYREKRREDIRRQRYSQPGKDNPARGETIGRISGAAIRADADARLAEIPDDTRDITGFLLGDPLPGRSALDQRGQRP